MPACGVATFLGRPLVACTSHGHSGGRRRLFSHLESHSVMHAAWARYGIGFLLFRAYQGTLGSFVCSFEKQAKHRKELYHKREIQIFVDEPWVQISVLAGVWHMVEDESRPQQIAQIHDSATTVTLQAPHALGSVLSYWVQEVDCLVQLGLHVKRSLEYVRRDRYGWHVHARAVASLEYPQLGAGARSSGAWGHPYLRDLPRWNRA